MPALYDYMKNQRRVRQSIHEAKKEAVSAQNQKRDEVLDFFEGRDCHDILRGYYAARYGYRLSKESDPNSGAEIYAYKRGMAADAIRYGMYQVAETKTLQRIVRSVSTLFTQPDQRFEFTAESETGEGEADAAILLEMRGYGGFLQHLIKTDRVSVLLGSSAIRIKYEGGRLKYSGGLGPQTFFVLWPESVLDGEQERAPDKSDIEDAEAVIHKLEDSASTQSSFQLSQYVAYFGRSATYEHGRCVVYWARDPYHVPALGSAGVIEYEVGAMGPCNPLTALQDTVADGSGYCQCEYPFAVLHGQDVGISSVFPETSFSLYDNAIECDLLNSRTMKAADVAARGSIAVILDQGGVPPENPDEGVCIMPRGARREISAVPSSGAVDASEVLKQVQLQIASGYGVPGYEVVSDGTGAPESGVALAIRSQPKREARRERVNSSTAFVDRVYQIERGLLRWFGPPDQWISPAVEQHWQAGEWQPPMSATERTAEIQVQYDLGVIDYVEAVRQANGLADRDAAKATIDGWKADALLYPGPNSRTALRIPPRGTIGQGLP
jgi:hypothetical protein